MAWICECCSPSIARLFSPYPGQGMEETHPVTCSVEFEEIQDPSVLQPGDSVTVAGETVLCRRVGIYLGNNEVIDFTNELRKLNMTDFTQNQPLSRVLYVKPTTDHDPGLVVQRAIDALKNPDRIGSYDIISNNSEHFATYCTFGNRLSYQGVNAAKPTNSSCILM
ncbi:hypothetical protein LSAT2_006937 [Lamellibrachia satsuma]|nr:hypothetical protein LSAT2_006937 [Lamellibrachia satsuma]